MHFLVWFEHQLCHYGFVSLSLNSRGCVTYMTVGCKTSSCCCVSSCCSRFLDSLSRALDSYLPKMSSYELLKAVYYLCLLGHFPSAPLEKLLQSSTLELFSSTGQTLNLLTHALSFCVCHLSLFFFLFLLHFEFHPSELPLFLSSTQVSPEPGKNVSDCALVPQS